MEKYKIRIESHDLIPTPHFSSMYPIMMVKPNDYLWTMNTILKQLYLLKEIQNQDGTVM